MSPAETGEGDIKRQLLSCQLQSAGTLEVKVPAGQLEANHRLRRVREALPPPPSPQKRENLVISPWSTAGKQNLNFFGGELESLDPISDPISFEERTPGGLSDAEGGNGPGLKVASISASA